VGRRVRRHEQHDDPIKDIETTPVAPDYADRTAMRAGRDWGIESMHWVLDVNFREDDSRTRERTLGNNLSWLRRFAVTLLKRHPDKDSLRGKMMSCMLNTDYLTQVLLLQHD
jgi:hypothetical protein